MSRENVEIVRRCVEHYVAGENEAALAAFHPEAEFEGFLQGRRSRVYRGADGITEALGAWTGTFSDYRVENEEFVDAGERVLLVARESGHGRGSGIRVEQVTYSVFTLKGGTIVRWQVFVDREKAYEAAGLGG
jgi:ketosteroid isomerase-like protein